MKSGHDIFSGILYESSARGASLAAGGAHSSGPIFRPLSPRGELLNERLSARAVARRVKHYAQQAGLDPNKYAGHSLRSGLATSAAAMGAMERSIMRQTVHKSTEMVRRYIREGSIFRGEWTDIWKKGALL